MTIESSYDLRTRGFAAIAGVDPGFVGTVRASAINGRYGFAASGTMVISVDLVDRVQIGTLTLPEGGDVSILEVSPDGTVLILVGAPLDWSAGWVHYVSLSGGDMTYQTSTNVPLGGDNSLLEGLAFGPDGIAYVLDRHWGVYIFPPPYNAATDLVPLPFQNDPLYSVWGHNLTVTPQGNQLLIGFIGAPEGVTAGGGIFMVDAPFSSVSPTNVLYLPESIHPTQMPLHAFPVLDGFLAWTETAAPVRRLFTRIGPPYTGSATVTVGTMELPYLGFMIG